MLLNLISLKSLDIYKWPSLTSISGAVQYLTSLEKLKMRDCNEFGSLNNVDADGIEWRHLNFLRYLKFDYLPKLESLPTGLYYLTVLEQLEIRTCHNLKSLSDGISRLKSLRSLTIMGVGLTSLPDGMGCLNSLKVLIIRSLPNLTNFPEISNLTSLQVLQIADCPKLSSLPDGISCLRSLWWLNIKDLTQFDDFLRRDYQPHLTSKT